MTSYFPAFVQALRNPHVATHLDDFVRGFSAAFENRFFSFSCFTASIFFDPSTAECRDLTDAIYTGFEQSILVDLIDCISIPLSDVTSRKMPMWARDDVLPFAQHFTRSTGVTYAPFIAALEQRFFTQVNVQKMIAASQRGPVGANELRNLFYAFASITLLSRALISSSCDATNTPMLAVYLQRVVERFHAEPQIVDFDLKFNGPINPAFAMDYDYGKMYQPVRPVAKDVRQDLCRVIVAAYRALVCSNAPAREILTWTQLALNSFHTHPDSMWAASRITIESRMAAAAAAEVAAAAVRANTTTTTFETRPPRPTATAAVVFTTTTSAPKTPKTPITPKTPKNTLRFEAALDNF